MSPPRSAQHWAEATRHLAYAASVPGTDREGRALTYAQVHAQLAIAAAIAEASEPGYAARWSAAILVPGVEADRDLIEAELDRLRGETDPDPTEVDLAEREAYAIARTALLLRAAASGNRDAQDELRRKRSNLAADLREREEQA